MNNTKRIIETIRKEKVLSIANILIMTITFLILAIFLTLVFATQSALTYLEQQTQVTAFFEDDFTEDKILTLKKELEKDERIFSVEYVSKQKALEIFMELNKDEPLLLESVSANILPASINVKTKQIGDLQVVSEELSKVQGVEGVKFFRDVVDSFKSIAKVIYATGFVLSGVFLFISYSAIVLLLRTYINRRGTELEIQKLVGASNAYVKKPIVAQGIFFSVISGVKAVLIIFLFTGIFQIIYGPQDLLVPFSRGVTISVWIYSTVLGGIILASSYFLGLIGSSSAVKKYLEY
ncbi:MAG TPA: permease-like cell division protein FtsX [bacterium]|nr:permease-like cell division protein FtsX [bacterium]